MKIVTRIAVLTLFIILIGAVGSDLTARRAGACGGLAQAVDCYDAASLSYSPRDPGPGDYVYINVVIDATLSNAPGFSETLYVDGQVVETNEVYYNGCEINVAYYYTCEGQQYPVFMTIPGRSCDGSSAGILGGLVVVGVLALYQHYFFLSTPKGNPKGVYGALKYTFWDFLVRSSKRRWAAILKPGKSAGNRNRYLLNG